MLDISELQEIEISPDWFSCDAYFDQKTKSFLDTGSGGHLTSIEITA